MAEDQDLLSQNQVTTGFWWVALNFGAQIRTALLATRSWALQDPIPETLVIAIALKETGPLFIRHGSKIPAQELLGLLIGDATGDYPGTEAKRSAFPKNAAAFRTKYDTETDTSFSDMLVEEANKSRKRLNNWPGRTWIYKGYGLFQYDLQNVTTDEKFFRDKLWYNFDDCMGRMLSIFAGKYAAAEGDLKGATRRYNGSGARAELYADKVFKYKEWCDPLWESFLKFEHRMAEYMAPFMSTEAYSYTGQRGFSAAMPAEPSLLRQAPVGQPAPSVLHIQPSAHIHAHSTPPWVRPDAADDGWQNNLLPGFRRFFPRRDP